MQEIPLKRPTRGTPAPAPQPVPASTPLILPEEPEDTSSPAPRPAGDSDEDKAEPDGPESGGSSGSTRTGGDGTVATAVTQQTSSDSPKKVFIRTFGCQMNEYDSDKMVDVLRKAHGAAKIVSTPEEADIILFNTCSIREKAQEKVFSELGRWRTLSEGAEPGPRHWRGRLRGQPGR